MGKLKYVNEVMMEPMTFGSFILRCGYLRVINMAGEMTYFQRSPCGASSQNGSYSTGQGSKCVYPK